MLSGSNGTIMSFTGCDKQDSQAEANPKRR